MFAGGLGANVSEMIVATSSEERSWKGIHLTDVALPAVFGLVATAEMIAQDYGPLWVSIGTYWGAVVVLCARRVYPLQIPLLIAAIYTVTPLLGFDVSEPSSWLLPQPLACFAVGLYRPRERALSGFAVVVAALVITFGALDILTDFDPDIIFGAFIGLGPWALGITLRGMLERNQRLAIDLERARIESEQAAAAAALAERERIARELHDVLAHSLSVMVVQAQLAEDLIDENPQSASVAVREVQQAGRDALGETGRLLRLIRDEQNELGMQPPHTVADLPALTDEYSRAGLDAELIVDPAAHKLPVGVGLSAYRIVQEGLTNALKHAPRSKVTVELRRNTEDLFIEVSNGPGKTTADLNMSGGHGLIGIRERVALFGGTFDASPTAGGGFVLTATIPVHEELE
jgi:signal transduction histidine kinase